MAPWGRKMFRPYGALGMGDRREPTGRPLREAIPAASRRGRSIGDLREAH
ncbi:hypothetical protein [Thermoflexus sp.]|nr:hypothetical protein [Thermoflexus sp.]